MNAIKGENHIIRVTLYETDGITVIPLHDLTLLRVSIKQANTSLATYIYGIDPELRDGTQLGEFELEIKKEVSRKFNSGVVKLEINLEKENALFDVDTVQRDIVTINILNVNGVSC